MQHWTTVTFEDFQMQSLETLLILGFRVISALNWVIPYSFQSPISMSFMETLLKITPMTLTFSNLCQTKMAIYFGSVLSQINVTGLLKNYLFCHCPRFQPKFDCPEERLLHCIINFITMSVNIIRDSLFLTLARTRPERWWWRCTGCSPRPTWSASRPRSARRPGSPGCPGSTAQQSPERKNMLKRKE